MESGDKENVPFLGKISVEYRKTYAKTVNLLYLHSSIFTLHSDNLPPEPGFPGAQVGRQGRIPVDEDLLNHHPGAHGAQGQGLLTG